MTKMLSASGGLRPPLTPWPGALPLAAYASEAEPPLLHITTLTTGFNEFAFTAQVKHKINSTQILGCILICLYFTTGHFHTCVLCKECSLFPF